MFIGIIKIFKANEGYGFIKIEGANDFFFHVSDYLNESSPIKAGQIVVCRLTEGIRGRSAKEVQLIKTEELFNRTLNCVNYNSKICVHSLYQVLGDISSIDDKIKWFKDFYDNYSEENIVWHKKFYDICKKYILEIKIESININPGLENGTITKKRRPLNLNKANHLIIGDLYAYFLSKTDEHLQFEIWLSNCLKLDNSNNNLITSSHANSPLGIPTSLFSKYYEQICHSVLIRLFEETKSTQLFLEVLNTRLNKLVNANTKGSVLLDILDSVLFAEKNKMDLVVEPYLNMLIQLLITAEDEVQAKRIGNVISSVFDVISQRMPRDFTDFFIAHENNIPHDLKFAIWKKTKCFTPNNTFYYQNLDKLSLGELRNSPAEFLESYVNDKIEILTDLGTLTNFLLLTLAITETQIKKLPKVVQDLNPIHKIAYLVNRIIPNNRSSSELSENISDFLFRLNDDLEQIVDIYELISITKCVQKITTLKQPLHTYNSEERKTFIIKLASERNVTQQDLIDFLKDIIAITKQDECIVFFKAIIPKTTHSGILKYEQLLEILENISSINQREILYHIGQQFPTLLKVRLWLAEKFDNITIYDVFEVFSDFNIDEQGFLARKLFTIIPDNNFDRESCFLFFSEIVKSENADLNVKICFAVLLSLEKNLVYLEENEITEIVLQFIEEKRNVVLQIDDLFEKCHGQTWRTPSDFSSNLYHITILGNSYPVEYNKVLINNSYYEIDNEKRQVEIEGKTYPYTWDVHEVTYQENLRDIPNGITFCDAKESIKDTSVNSTFFWCCNNRCYNPNQKEHSALEWKKYTLKDFIKILTLPLNSDKYYRFLSLLNRANRLLKKLECSSCKRLLKDAKTSEFAFYRVTTFHCTNIECTSYHELVYLTHCSNWKCLNIVDSRISKKCPNGWYICDRCNYCCSNQKLEQRLVKLIENKSFNLFNPRHAILQNQVENKLGHFEKNEFFNFRNGQKL